MGINVIRVASIVGTALGLVGTIVSSWAGEKARDAKIVEEVAKALAEQTKEQ